MKIVVVNELDIEKKTFSCKNNYYLNLIKFKDRQFQTFPTLSYWRSAKIFNLKLEKNSSNYWFLSSTILKKEDMLFNWVIGLFHGITKYGIHSLTQRMLAMDKELTYWQDSALDWLSKSSRQLVICINRQRNNEHS